VILKNITGIANGGGRVVARGANARRKEGKKRKCELPVVWDSGGEKPQGVLEERKRNAEREGIGEGQKDYHANRVGSRRIANSREVRRLLDSVLEATCRRLIMSCSPGKKGRTTKQKYEWRRSGS